MPTPVCPRRYAQTLIKTRNTMTDSSDSELNNPEKDDSNTHPALSRVEEITGVLREEILRGQYRPGERLPSERELSTRFDSNRGAVRESLKKLEQMGIAIIKPGGVRVIPVEEATLSILGHIIDLHEIPDAKVVADLFEVLRALITLSARNAVNAATDKDVIEMTAIVETMITSLGDSVETQQCWKKLSTLFTQISHNLVLRLILNGLKTQFVSRLESKRPSIELNQSADLKILQRLREGIITRDSEAVSQAISEHFTLLQNAVVSALTEAAKNTRSANV
jgi:DNA-binding FadR family transcriptional regulator